MPGETIQPAAHASRRNAWLAAGAVLLAALAIRGVYLAELPELLWSSTGPVRDTVYYDLRAREVAAGDLVGRTPEFLSPLYSYVMGALYALPGGGPETVRAAQAVLGALSCALLVLIGARVASVTVGALAGSMLAVYGLHVFYSGVLLPTVLVTSVNLLAVWILLEAGDRLSASRGAVAGVVLGLAVLAKANAVLMIPVAAAWIWYSQQRSSAQRRAWLTAALVLGAAVAIAPVTYKNYRLSSEFVLVTTTGGLNLYKGNGPRATGTHTLAGEGPRLPRIGAKAHVDGTVDPQEVVEVSRELSADARRHMLENPGQAAALFLKKLLLFLHARELFVRDNYYFARESSMVLRLLVPGFGMVVPIGLAGVAMSWPARRRFALLYGVLAVQIVSFVLVFVLARYRLVAVSVLMVFAAWQLVCWYEWAREHRWRPVALSAVVLAAAAALALRPLPEFPRTRGYASQHDWWGDRLAERGDHVAAAWHFQRALLTDWSTELGIDEKQERTVYKLERILGDVDPATALEILEALDAGGVDLPAHLKAHIAEIIRRRKEGADW